MQVIHHGGKHTVTGSCHELRLGRCSLLIDCGLYQGGDSSVGAQKVNFKVGHIKALLVTHAHIDHIGRIPWLLAAGFTGPIYCSEATAALIPLMLEDGLLIQGLSRGDVQRVLDLIRKRIKPLKYNRWERIALENNSDQYPYVYLRLQPAGHILGSAYLEIKLPKGEIVLFSGDLGVSDTPLLPDPKPPARADYLYLESTYGNKLHENVAQRSERLNAIIQHSLKDGGAIIIPAFSVGRTQELLFDIERLIHEQDLSSQLPVILDSPLANRVTRQYRHYKKLWGREAKQRLSQNRHPLAFSQCIKIQDHRQHQALVNRLQSTAEPVIVIAASGMCSGGRVMNYLKALLPDKRTDVIFAGYQAQGTLGREIQSGAKVVQLEGERIKVEGQIHTISGYSAHADQNELINFVQGIAQKPKEIHLIHGEPHAQHALRKKLKETRD
jgi:metallo-beta-lactamase family protein